MSRVTVCSFHPIKILKLDDLVISVRCRSSNTIHAYTCFLIPKIPFLACRIYPTQEEIDFSNKSILNCNW